MITASQLGEYNIPDAAHYDQLEAPCSQCIFPIEILEKIIEYYYYNGDINHIYSINSNIQQFHKSLATVNSTFYLLSLKYSYRYANFTRSTSFDNFLSNLRRVHNLGNYVHFIDFMEFTSIGLGRTAQMMQDIQMVTSRTILEALKLTPNLIEFLASESIETDIDLNVVDYLFNNLNKLEALDFCGSSGLTFRTAFKNLVIRKPINESSIHKLSFHDCTELTNDIFHNILPHLALTRLDLTHTQISINTLSRSLHRDTRLTHLSIGKCSQIGTTRDIIDFLVDHPAVNHGTLQWLNLQIDTTMESPFNDLTLKFLLTKLNSPLLKYINLSGIKVSLDHLNIISNKFLLLKSLVLSHTQLTIEELTKFLSSVDNLRFLDLTGNKKINRWSIENQAFLTACPKLIAIEVDTQITTTLTETRIGGVLSIWNNKSQSNDYWKTFDNNGQGRRSWVFKLNNAEKIQQQKGQEIRYNNNIIYFDMKTGEKILKKVKFPSFLKFASRKINVSNGLFYNPYNDEINEYDDWVNDHHLSVEQLNTIPHSSSTNRVHNPINEIIIHNTTSDINHESHTSGTISDSGTTTTTTTVTNNNDTNNNSTNNNDNNNNNNNENTNDNDNDNNNNANTHDNKEKDKDRNTSVVDNSNEFDNYNVFPVEFSQRGIYKYYSLSR